MKKTAFGIIGAYGRMGQAIARLSQSDADLDLIAAYEHAAHLGQGKPFTADARVYDFPLRVIDEKTLAVFEKETRPKAIVDFSLPLALSHTVELCRAKKIPLVIGTTGYDDEQLKEIEVAAQDIPVLLASNMSLGVNLLFALVEKAAQALKGKQFDVEIMEVHHKHKKDAPSGTAKSIEEILLSTGIASNPIYGREGQTGERKDSDLGVMALRGGDVVGDHTVFFFGEGERLELKHQAHSRDTFAQGALNAVKYIADRKPGLYGMRDVLNLR